MPQGTSGCHLLLCVFNTLLKLFSTVLHKLLIVPFSLSHTFLTRFCPPPSTRRGPPIWVRRQRGQAEAMEKRQTEEQERAEYISSLEAKRLYPPHVVEALRNIDADQIQLELILELVKVICRGQDPGAILVFLPGWDTISKLHDMLKADPVFRSRNYLIIPLHSLMPTSFQQSVSHTFCMYIVIYSSICASLTCICTATLHILPHPRHCTSVILNMK